MIPMHIVAAKVFSNTISGYLVPVLLTSVMAMLGFFSRRQIARHDELTNTVRNLTLQTSSLASSVDTMAQERQESRDAMMQLMLSTNTLTITLTEHIKQADRETDRVYEQIGRMGSTMKPRPQ